MQIILDLLRRINSQHVSENGLTLQPCPSWHRHASLRDQTQRLTTHACAQFWCRSCLLPILWSENFEGLSSHHRMHRFAQADPNISNLKNGHFNVSNMRRHDLPRKPNTQLLIASRVISPVKSFLHAVVGEQSRLKLSSQNADIAQQPRHIVAQSSFQQCRQSQERPHGKRFISKLAVAWSAQ